MVGAVISWSAQALDENAIRLELLDSESGEGNGKFLRHSDYVCWVDEDDQGDDLLQKDSTFLQSRANTTLACSIPLHQLPQYVPGSRTIPTSFMRV